MKEAENKNYGSHSHNISPEIYKFCEIRVTNEWQLWVLSETRKPVTGQAGQAPAGGSIGKWSSRQVSSQFVALQPKWTVEGVSTV